MIEGGKAMDFYFQIAVASPPSSIVSGVDGSKACYNLLPGR
jgi:hypothetical protein